MALKERKKIVSEPKWFGHLILLVIFGIETIIEAP
jgi:hypothetical protein